VPTQDNPIIVQSDRTILLEVDRPTFAEARDMLAAFAELEKSPEHVYTYKLSHLSLWNAAAAGMTAEMILQSLTKYSKYAIPGNIVTTIQDAIGRYGRIKLRRDGDLMVLYSPDSTLIIELLHNKKLEQYLLGQVNANTLIIDPARRGHVKQILIGIGYPAEDIAGYTQGLPLEVTLQTHTHEGKEFALRQYQQSAVDVFYANGADSGGSGVVVLPCGAGKTVVGIGTLAAVGRTTLILSPNTVAVRQWIQEILDKTSLTADMVGEYTGERKDIRPVTVTTYQILTYHASNSDTFPHFSLITDHNWGLIIYDEVHLLPAPVFRVTAEIQARRRLGLTATLVREDGRESDVFSLIGPKKYDVPWRELERQGWIATAECYEIRTSLADNDHLTYAVAEDREKYRISAENPRKLDIVKALVKRHEHDQVLIIGQYIEQLKQLSEMLDAPLLTGKTPNGQRQKLYEGFRQGNIKTLVVSKVANFAIDLPDANVAIQVSGTYGSRQEEAQRLGRILRPKAEGIIASFYTVVTRETKDQDFAARRQLFLTEQGYRYIIQDAETAGL